MGLEYLLIGLLLGITAGISPGPLLALVISETVKRGKMGGIKVALAPLFTDIPLIIATFLVLNHIKNLDILLGMISLTGALVLFYLGYKDIRIGRVNLKTDTIPSSSLKKGILTNLLNPHPYVFWLFVGVPFMIKGNTFERVAFVLSFLSSIVVSKIVLALAVEKGKEFIGSRYYCTIIKALGFVLMFFSLILLKDAIRYLME